MAGPVSSRIEQVAVSRYVPVACAHQLYVAGLTARTRPQAELQDRLPCGSFYQISSSRAQRVHRTAHATLADIEHMRVDHRRLNIGMAKQFLHCADVVA